MSTSNYGILESRSAFWIGHTLDKLCQDLSGYPDVGVRSPVNYKRTLQFLNQGHFHELLMCLADMEQYQLHYDKGMWMVLLGAYSMKLGATIEKEDLLVIRFAVQHIEIHAEARKQMEKALNEYKSNGEGWDFESSSIGMRLPSADSESAYRKLDQPGYESNPGRSVPIEEMEDENMFAELGLLLRENSQLSAQLRSCTEQLLDYTSAQLKKVSEQTKQGSEDQKDAD